MKELDADFTYCVGDNCKIRNQCKRFLPKHLRPNHPLWWFSTEYDKNSNDCVNKIEKL